MTDVDTAAIRERVQDALGMGYWWADTAWEMCDALDAARAERDTADDLVRLYEGIQEQRDQFRNERDEWHAIAEHRLAMYKAALSHACRSAAQVAAVRAWCESARRCRRTGDIPWTEVAEDLESVVPGLAVPAQPGQADREPFSSDTKAAFASEPLGPAGVDGTPGWAYSEDGYCIRCGNGRWKCHMPDCELRGALDVPGNSTGNLAPEAGCPECSSRGAVEVNACTCGSPLTQGLPHEPGCGLEPCPRGCEYLPPAPPAGRNCPYGCVAVPCPGPCGADDPADYPPIPTRQRPGNL